MAQSSYPFENVDTTETQFSQMFRTLNAGVNGTPSGTELKVTAGTGLQVAVAAGQAMVRGHYYISTASENLTIGTASGSNPRIDSIVLRLDPTANSVILAVVAGTPASSPVAPTLTQTDAGVYEYQLATVLIPTSATSVSTITDTRSFMGDRVGVWSTDGRPTDGKFRVGYNTTLGYPEYYNGSTWNSFSTTAVIPQGNAIINGAFDFWQRGTSLTYAGGYPYLADRWRYAGDGSGATRVISQQTFAPGTIPVTGYEGQYFHRFNQTVAGTGGTFSVVETTVEDVRNFAGQTVTFSFWAKADSARTIQAGVSYQIFGTGGSSNVFIAPPSVNITSTWTRYSVTQTLPSISGKTIGINNHIIVGFTLPNNAVQTFDLWGVQLEAGSVATPFKRNAPSVQAELAACQRYYTKSYDAATYAGGVTGTGAYTLTVGNNTTGYLVTAVRFPVTMRTAPTITTYDYAGAAGKVYKGGNGKTAYVSSTSNGGSQIGTADSTSGNELAFQYIAEAEF